MSRPWALDAWGTPSIVFRPSGSQKANHAKGSSSRRAQTTKISIPGLSLGAKPLIQSQSLLHLRLIPRANDSCPLLNIVIRERTSYQLTPSKIELLNLQSLTPNYQLPFLLCCLQNYTSSSVLVGSSSSSFFLSDESPKDKIFILFFSSRSTKSTFFECISCISWADNPPKESDKFGHERGWRERWQGGTRPSHQSSLLTSTLVLSVITFQLPLMAISSSFMGHGHLMASNQPSMTLLNQISEMSDSVGEVVKNSRPTAKPTNFWATLNGY